MIRASVVRTALAPTTGACALLALLVVACGPRVARETVFERDGTVVQLRSELRDGEPVPRGFAHPVTIAPVRLSNVLSRIEVRMERTPGLLDRLGSNESEPEDERELAVPAELLREVGEGLARGLERAGPDQEVVVTAIRRERRLGIFTRRHLTGLVAWAEGESLRLHFSHVDWEIPRDEDKLPEPRPDKSASRFRVLPSEAIVPTGAHAVAVAWRDPTFAGGRGLRISPSGRVLRRTILMESPGEGAEEPDGGTEIPAIGSGQLSPETLRALADLEEARRRGEITEAEYQARRVELLGR